MKKIIIGVVAVFLFVVAGRVFWAYKQVNTDEQQQLPISVLAPTVAISTSTKLEVPVGWKIYKDNELGFEFQYPESYEIASPDFVVAQEVMSSEEGEILQIKIDNNIKIGVSFNANGIGGLSSREIKQESGYFYELDYIDDSGKKIWIKEVAKSSGYPIFGSENCTTENICLFFYHILNLKGEPVAVFTANVDSQKMEINKVSLFRSNFGKIVKSFIILK